MNSIVVNKINKKYKNGVTALDNLSINVKQGEIFTLLGPNGAGKSTLINILTTYIKPDSGSITISGEELTHNAGTIRSHIACVSQRNSIDSFLSLKENMLFRARLYKVPRHTALERINNLISAFDLKRYSSLPVVSYSGGVKRRLDIALSLISCPDILFLDEPTTGMDVQSRKRLWDMIRLIQQDFGTTIFLTTHYLEEADNLSTNICIMNNGHELIQDSPSSLRHFLHQDKIEISFPLDSEIQVVYPQIQRNYPNLQWILAKDTITCCYSEGLLNINSLTRFLLDKNISITGIRQILPSLEDVFLSLTKSEANI